MKRLVAQLLGGTLVVLVLLAGLAGLSPVWHHWLEHGGHGSLHVHGWGVRNPASPDLQIPASSGDADGGATAAVRRALVESHQFRLPAFSLQAMRAWARNVLEHGWLSGSTERDSGTDPAPDHQHDSLAQLLALGLADVSVVMMPVVDPVHGVYHFRFPPSVLLPSAAWNAATASRGPPGCVS